MRFQLRSGRVAIACLITACWLRADDLPRPAAAKPLASVVALAAAQHIPLQGIDPAREAPVLRPGDAVTVLFTLFENGHTRQWLAEIKVVPLTGEERRAKPRHDVVYTGTGNEYRLPSAPAAYAMRMFGPFAETDGSIRPGEAVPEKHARFLVQEGFLSFGFDRYCEMVLRLRTIGQEPRLGVMTGRFTEKDIAGFKHWADQARFTADLAAATAKLSGQAKMVTEFGELGLGQAFRYLTGVIEVGGVALLSGRERPCWARSRCSASASGLWSPQVGVLLALINRTLPSPTPTFIPPVWSVFAGCCRIH